MKDGDIWNPKSKGYSGSGGISLDLPDAFVGICIALFLLVVFVICVAFLGLVAVVILWGLNTIFKLDLAYSLLDIAAIWVVIIFARICFG